ncbi:PQQ-binding-like beta-propeller repeat protein [Haloarchaeobius sp. DFWS5]|uniref:outer membrane protein assembly factor BamB family protein n=1 Tax=Haloarchaeobius sp. DFWS5 TaxID=3446114 RepID=UPI003EBDF8ED
MSELPSADRRTALKVIAGSGAAALLGSPVAAALDPDEVSDTKWETQVADDVVGQSGWLGPVDDRTNLDGEWTFPYHFQTDEDPETHIVGCLGTDGDVLWENSYSAVYGHAADREHLYTADETGVYAIDRQSGETMWSVTGDTLKTSVNALAVDDGTLFVDTEGRLWALDTATGEPMWNTGPRCANEMDEVGQMAVTDTAVVTPVQTELRAYDRATGEELWTFDEAEYVMALDGHKETVYVGHRDWITAFDATTGEQRWENNDAYVETIATNDYGVVVGRTIDIEGDLYEGFSHDGTKQWRAADDYYELTAPAVQSPDSETSVAGGTEDGVLLHIDQETGELVNTSAPDESHPLDRHVRHGDNGHYATSSDGYVFRFVH